MSNKNIHNLQKTIERLENEHKQKKALLNTKKQALKNQKRKIERRARNHRIYTLGGCVEKAGLFNLDEATVLGLLAYAHNIYEKASPQARDDIRKKGEAYIEAGKQLEQLK